MALTAPDLSPLKRSAATLLLAGLGIAAAFASPAEAQRLTTTDLFAPEPSPTPTREELIEERRQEEDAMARTFGKCAGYLQGSQIMLITQFDMQDDVVRDLFRRLDDPLDAVKVRVQEQLEALSTEEIVLFTSALTTYFNEKNASVTEILVAAQNEASFPMAEKMMYDSIEGCYFTPDGEQITDAP